MTLQIVHDLDDTVFSCADSLQKFAEEEYGLSTDKCLRDYHNLAMVFNIDSDKATQIIAAFHRSKYMGKMEPLPCAAKMLPELHSIGFKFIAVTACPNEKEIEEHRKLNLRNIFGFEWEAVHCVGINQSKREILSQYEPTIWVDDLYQHALVGAELGYRSFLIDMPYNQHTNHNDVIRVKDWYEIAELL